MRKLETLILIFTVGDGHAHFTVIREENTYDYTPLSTKLNMGWKTEALKGVIQVRMKVRCDFP